MQQRTSILSVFTLSTAMAFGAAALAADLPKEGKYNGTSSGDGYVQVNSRWERAGSDNLGRKRPFVDRRVF